MSLYDLAEVFVASWVLSGDPLVPTTTTDLARGFKRAFAAGAYPRWACDGLDVRRVLVLAQRLELIDLTYGPTSEIKISRLMAERILERLGVSLESALHWGLILREAIRLSF